jgi:SagB-type dehydrogenase family enzyme
VRKDIVLQAQSLVPLFQRYMAKSRIKKFHYGDEPKHWLSPQFKEYPRLPKLKLPKPQLHFGKDLSDCIQLRESPIYLKSSVLTKLALSTLLAASSGLSSRSTRKGKYQRVHPSAGAKYPLEVYPIVLSSNEIPQGIYHYGIKEHTLDVLLQEDVRERVIRAVIPDSGISRANCLFVITAVLGRTVEKYGERGFRYILLEAGHLAQNLALSATALNIGCLSIGGFLDLRIAEMLDLDADLEPPLYLLALGKAGL